MLAASHRPSWTDRYLSIPFASRGRGWSGCDCWGLVRLVYQEEFGVHLPRFDDYADVSDVASIHRLSHDCLALWTRIMRPLAGVVCHCVFGDGRHHVGVMVDRERMLHIERGKNACIEGIAKYRNQFRGFYVPLATLLDTSQRRETA